MTAGGVRQDKLALVFQNSFVFSLDGVINNVSIKLVAQETGASENDAFDDIEIDVTSDGLVDGFVEPR